MSCRCSKFSFNTKRLAKAAIRGFRGRKGRLHAYRCPDSPYWHIGHLPAALIAGVLDRREIPPKPRPVGFTAQLEPLEPEVTTTEETPAP